jgi:hypothetical protein
MLDCVVCESMELNFSWLELLRRNCEGFFIPGHNNRSKEHSPVWRKQLALNQSDQTPSEFDNPHMGP